MHFFFLPAITGEEVTLSPEESRHCISVLRCKKNDQIRLINGEGVLANAVILKPDTTGTKVRVIEKIVDYRKRNNHLHIAIAPTKKADRFEWFLEKATEIGIDEITPLICSRSERPRINMERASRIIIGAMKQSQRAFLPKLNPLQDFRSFITDNRCKSKIITHCNSQALPRIAKSLIPITPVAIMVGPEGDFTMEEVNQATIQGFRAASLGGFVYRTETAGIMACHLFNLIYDQL
ncbi:MAG: hypothetical protein AMS27_00795 [Bacteroides sp. SM23_62_1]|nr:MAG: hypothetical protein AMS27_00795 [Bacteroides sp. SM23_62_1]